MKIIGLDVGFGVLIQVAVSSDADEDRIRRFMHEAWNALDKVEEAGEGENYAREQALSADSIFTESIEGI